MPLNYINTLCITYVSSINVCIHHCTQCYMQSLSAEVFFFTLHIAIAVIFCQYTIQNNVKVAICTKWSITFTTASLLTTIILSCLVLVP